jgi:hypothetical protein
LLALLKNVEVVKITKLLAGSYNSVRIGNMKTLVIFFMFPVALYSAEMYDNIQVVRQSSNQILLTAQCEAIGTLLSGLNVLKVRLGNQSTKMPLINQIENSLCSSEISTLIPTKILELHDTTTAYPGPNCWNTSLYTNKIVQSRRATAEEEMTYWMNSPLCRELLSDEAELPGDIIAIRNNQIDKPIEMHGFTYITKAFSFSKSGFDIQFPYELTSSEYVYHLFALGEYEDYKANPECRRVEGKPDMKKCPVYANVFRCISYDDFLNTTNFNSKNNYLKLDSKFLNFEKKLSNDVVVLRDFSMAKSLILTDELRLLENEYNSYISSHSIDSDLWNSLKYRILSFHVQLDLLNTEI